jgi:hypothetical protein
MRNFNDFLCSKSEVMQKNHDLLHGVIENRERRRKQAHDIRVELGINALTDPVLYAGFLNMLNNDAQLQQFLDANCPVDRRFILEHNASAANKRVDN